MAYISKEEAAEIRKELKTTSPQIKFSVTVEHYTSLNVSIMEADVKFSEREYEQLNHFYTERYPNGETLKKIVDICNRKNFDKSDTMTDYFNVGYYFNLNVGKWDKPFKLRN